MSMLPAPVDAAACDLRRCAVTGATALVSLTGTSAVAFFVSSSNHPCRYCSRHPKTWFVFTSCARAMRDTDAPGFSVSSTICRRSAFVRNRLPPRISMTAGPPGHGECRQTISAARRPRADAYVEVPRNREGLTEICRRIAIKGRAKSQSARVLDQIYYLTAGNIARSRVR